MIDNENNVLNNIISNKRFYSSSHTQSAPTSTNKDNLDNIYSVIFQHLHSHLRGTTQSQSREGGSFNTSSSQNKTSGDQAQDSKSSVWSFTSKIFELIKSFGNFVRSAVSQIRGAGNMNEDTNDFNANCGPAALEGALRALGLSKGDENSADGDIEKVRRAMGGGNNEYSSTDTYQLAKGAKALGASYTKVYDANGSIDKLKQEVRGGKQVIFRVLNSSGGGHFMRVERIDGDVAWVHDPLNPNGNLIPMSLDEVAARMKAAGNHMVAIGK